MKTYEVEVTCAGDTIHHIVTAANGEEAARKAASKYRPGIGNTVEAKVICEVMGQQHINDAPTEALNLLQELYNHWQGVDLAALTAEEYADLAAELDALGNLGRALKLLGGEL